MNQIILIGNLTRDVILRPTANDTFVGSSAIAVSSTRKNEKGEYETDFFDLRFFGNTAESVAKRFRKGDKICVVGRVQIRDYVTKDNIKGRAVEVLVDRVEGLSPRRDENKDDSSCRFGGGVRAGRVQDRPLGDVQGVLEHLER